MPSQIELCNQALSLLGTRSTIASINEASTEARQCKLLFDTTRDAVLRAAPWSFATAMEAGALLKSAPGTPENPTAAGTVWNSATTPPPPWLYTYAYPADCVAIREVAAQTGAVASVPIFGAATRYGYGSGPNRYRWSKGNDIISGSQAVVLWTDARQALFTYTRRVTDVNLWDELFADAFTSALAAEIAFALTGKLTLKKFLMESSFQKVIEARVRDGNESGTQIYDQPVDWLSARDVDYDYGVSYR